MSFLNPEEIGTLLYRARWIAWIYDLDQYRVLKVLEGVEISLDIENSDQAFTRYIFKPSLEETLLYLRPQVAMRWFESGKYDEITTWLEMTTPLLLPHRGLNRSIEGIVGMEGTTENNTE